MGRGDCSGEKKNPQQQQQRNNKKCLRACLCVCMPFPGYKISPLAMALSPPVAMVIKKFYLLHNPSVNIQRHTMLVVIYAFLPLPQTF